MDRPRVAAFGAVGAAIASILCCAGPLVMRYDPRKVTPAQIATHLTRLTGYGARIIEASARRGG